MASSKKPTFFNTQSIKEMNLNWAKRKHKYEPSFPRYSGVPEIMIRRECVRDVKENPARAFRTIN